MHTDHRLYLVLPSATAALLVAVVFVRGLFATGATGRWAQPALDLALLAVALLLMVAVCAAVFRLVGRLRRRSRELEALYEATLDLHGDLSLKAVLSTVVDRARELVGARYGAVSVVDAQGTIREFVTAGISDELREEIGDPPRGRGLLGVVLKGGKHLRLRDLGADPRSVGFPPGHPPMKSLLAVPITCRSPFRGNLYVAEKRSAAEFSTEDQQTLERFAAAAGTAIDTANLHARLRSLAVSEDRTRIAFELHDGMAQVLAYINAKSQAIAEHLRRDATDEAQRHLMELAAGARDLYGDVREGILALNTRLTPDRSFGDALGEFVANWRERYDVPVTLAVDGGVTLAPPVALQVLRIVQEALSNARKHAGASRVEVKVERDDDRCLRVTVADDGRGFVPESPPRSGSPRFGLLMMRERAEAVGGTLELDSAPGRGTRLVVAVPPRLDHGAGAG